MKRTTILICVLIFSANTGLFGQKVGETGIAIGFNNTLSNEEFKMRWSEEYSPPIFLNIRASKSWYRNDHKIALRKEVGLNLQYAKIGMGGGGLAAGNYYSGKIISLFAEASLLLRVRVDSTISLGIGPTAEYLLIGSNNLNNSYYTIFTNPPSSGDINYSGINRDYFNQPSYGIKLSIFNLANIKRYKVGLNFSYLWTKNEHSNFFLSNYLNVSLLLSVSKTRNKL